MTQTESCVFCILAKDKKITEVETRYFFSFFDNNPVSPGHTLLIPKRHVPSLLDLNDKEWSELKPSIKQVIKIIENGNLKQTYQQKLENSLNEISTKYCQKILTHLGIDKKPDGYNIGVNEGEAAGRTIDHLHFHIIPRFFGDVEDRIGGIRHIIPKVGNYKK